MNAWDWILGAALVVSAFICDALANARRDEIARMRADD